MRCRELSSLAGSDSVVEVTADIVPRRDLLELGPLLPADGLALGTALVEGTALGRVGRVGHVALKDDALLGQVGVGDGDGAGEGLGVGVELVGKQLVRLGHLHDVAQVHDGTRSLMYLTTDRSWEMKR